MQLFQICKGILKIAVSNVFSVHCSPYAVIMAASNGLLVGDVRMYLNRMVI